MISLIAATASQCGLGMNRFHFYTVREQFFFQYELEFRKSALGLMCFKI
jgi:hypothetical protein